MVVCPRCGRTFKSQQGLSGHQRLKHSSATSLPNLPVFNPALAQAKAEVAQFREKLATSQRKIAELEAVSKKNLEVHSWETSELQRKYTMLKLEFNNQHEIHNIETKNITDERNLLQAKIKELQNQIAALEKELQNRVSTLEAEKSQLKLLKEAQDRLIKEKDKSIEYWKGRLNEDQASKEAEKPKIEISQPSTTQSHLSHMIPPPPTLNPVKGLRDLRGYLHNLQQPKI